MPQEPHGDLFTNASLREVARGRAAPVVVRELREMVERLKTEG
jgi:hypothetical protein